MMKFQSSTLAACAIFLQILATTLQDETQTSTKNIYPRHSVTCVCSPKYRHPDTILCYKIKNISSVTNTPIRCFVKTIYSEEDIPESNCLNTVDDIRSKYNTIYLLEFSNCSPNISFRDTMDELGISKIEELKVTYPIIRSNHLFDTKLLENLTDLTKLDLSKNQLNITIEDITNEIPNLIQLNLMGNKVKLDPHIFNATTRLKALELGNNSLGSLQPGVFRNMRNLLKLNIWGNGLTELKRELFSDTPTLNLLDVSSNYLHKLESDVFADLRNLMEINLYANKFVNLSEELFLNNCELKNVSIKGMKTLQNIPRKLLANLTKLENLNLSSNSISLVPEDLIWGSKSIKKIKLKENSITELPERFLKDAEKLQYIDLSGNKIANLSNNTFKQTKNLQTLNLANNQLTHIDGKIFSKLSLLTYLDLSFNKIKTINNNAFRYTNKLTYLNLKNNFLYTAQDKFSTLQYLKTLDLSNNLISAIPEDWTEMNLVFIKKINLSQNNFSVLKVDSILQLKGNEIDLDLSHNNISVIDLSWQMYNITALFPVSVQLDGNPLNCDCNSYDIWTYYNQKQTKMNHNAIEFNIKDLQCATPERLKNYIFIDLPRNELKCEVETCKKILTGKECECLMQPNEFSLEIECKNSKNLTIPDISDKMPLNNFSNFNISLNLTGNSMKHLSKDSYKALEYMQKIDLSFNELSEINIKKLSPKIEVLKLHNNKLTSLDSSSIEIIEKAKTLKTITLHNNPWQCDCAAKKLLSFIKLSKKIDMLENITCVGGDLHGKPMLQIMPDDICHFSTTEVAIVIIIITLIGILCVITGLKFVFSSNNGKINRNPFLSAFEESDSDRPYDAFICYSHHDEYFVRDELVPGLERDKHKFRLCLHYKDWLVGGQITTQIETSVETSRRTIIILSPNFPQSTWANFEFKIAKRDASITGTPRLIVILHGDSEIIDELDPEFKKYVYMNTYLKSDDPLFWDKLVTAILPNPNNFMCSNFIYSMFSRKKRRKANKKSFIKENLGREKTRLNLNIDQEDLIKKTDLHVSQPQNTTPPANSCDEMSHFLP